MTLFYTIKKQRTGPIYLNDESIYEYVDIVFGDQEINWHENPIDGKGNDLEIPAR